jgi:hypothetical protein
MEKGSQMKTAITAALLLFVGISVIYLVAGESKQAPGEKDPALNTTGQAADPPSAEIARPAIVTAYYFHGDMRCPTCLKMEQFAREAVEQEFKTEIDEGAVAWQAVNYDETANEHFVSEYQLSASAVVLVAGSEIGEGQWRNLDRIWNLVSDEHAFKDYVVESVREMLQEQS